MVTRVTIYDQGVEIIRQGTCSLSQGQSRLVFAGLPLELDPNSVRVEVRGAGIALKGLTQDTVSSGQDSPVVPEPTQERRQALVEQVKLRKEARQLLQQEHDFVRRSFSQCCEATTAIPSGENRVTPMPVDDLFAMMSYATDSEADFLKRIREASWAVEDAEEELRLASITTRPEPEPQERRVTVVVSAAAAVDAFVGLCYVTTGASWSPEYEVRVGKSHTEVSVAYNASIVQNTQEKWDNVEVVLSTAQPSLTGRQPEMQPWRVDTRVQEMPMLTGAVNAVSASTEVYSIPGRHDITIGEALRLPIAQLPLTCEVSYVTVPRMEAAAYAVASVTNASVYTLLGGTASVFLDGAFVTRTPLHRVATGESFQVHLGRDDAVAVTHKLLSRHRREGGSAIFGKTQVIAYRYETSVRNGKRAPVSITIRERLPVSNDSSIVVTLVKPTVENEARDLALRHGLLEQQKTISPGESVSLPLELEIAFPLGREIRGAN